MSLYDGQIHATCDTSKHISNRRESAGTDSNGETQDVASSAPRRRSSREGGQDRQARTNEDQSAGGGSERRRIQSDAAFFFFQAEDGIRDYKVTGVQTCALPI